MKKTLPEIFEEIKSASTKEEKLKLLNMYYSVSVAACLSMLFNPKIKLNLPVGIPEDFKFNNTPSLSLERALRSFPAFVNGTNGIKLQTAWNRIMSSVSEAEAKFAFALKDKDYDIGLTQDDIHNLYPTLIPAPLETVPSKSQKVPETSSSTEKVNPDVEEEDSKLPSTDDENVSLVKKKKK